MIKYREMLALGALFVVMALFYSLVIPIFEGPDEDDHFRYAKFIADHRAFPVQQFQPGGGEAGHQGWQPPLYYSLAAALMAPVDTSDFQQHLWRNDLWTAVGDPACCGRNIYFHTASENFPFTGTTLAVHLGRLLSIFFGLVTVVATYALIRVLLPERKGLALAGAAVVAFNPSFLFASALVSNDAALAAFSTLVLLVWVLWLGGRLEPNLRSAAVGGLLVGIAVLTKTTAVGLVPLTMVAFGIAALRRRGLRTAVTGNLVLLAALALVCGWWLVRNQALYGDPLALKLVASSALFPRSGPLTLAELFQISLPWWWQTLWGGPTPGDMSPIILGALAVLSVLAVIGGSQFQVPSLQAPFGGSKLEKGNWRRSAWRQSNLEPPEGVAKPGTWNLEPGTSDLQPPALRASNIRFLTSGILLLAWLVLILAAQVQFIRTTVGADQGRYLFPAIAVFALFFVAGLEQISRWLIRSAARALGPSARWRLGSLSAWLIGGFFLLALYVPFAYTLPAYAHPPLLSEGDLARVPHPVQFNLGNQMELRGYDLEPRSVKPGDTLRVTLYWRGLARMSESYRVFVHLIGLNNRSAGGVDVIPGRGAFPTVYWQPGDVLRDEVQVPVSAGAAPGQYSIEVGLYPAGKPGERVVLVGSDEDRAILDRVKVAPRQPLAFSPQRRIEANFADKASLIGYDAQADSRSLTLTLYWQALGPLERDYTVFVHLLGPDGHTVDQVDLPPQAGNYPTSLWQTGEQIRDEYTLSLQGGAMSSYRVELGLYDQKTLERLPVRIGNLQSDHVELSWAQ